MEPRRNLFGLSAQAKALLIEKLSSTPPVRSPGLVRRSDPENDDATARLDVSKLEGFREIRMIREAAEFLKAEIARWGKVIQQAKVKIE